MENPRLFEVPLAPKPDTGPSLATKFLGELAMTLFDANGHSYESATITAGLSVAAALIQEQASLLDQMVDLMKPMLLGEPFNEAKAYQLLSIWERLTNPV